jgi:hypothetical protein
MGERIAVFGGVYSNYLALAAAIADARSKGVDALYCLGDLGAFGPHPDRVFPLLRDNRILCIQGNYDLSIASDFSDCQCGYTDPRDNYFAQISYEYTYRHTSEVHRRWLRGLPGQRRLTLVPRQPAANQRVLVGIDDIHSISRPAVPRIQRRRHPRYPYRHQMAPAVVW